MSRIYLSPPHLSGEERAMLADALDSNWIAPVGPHLDRFEAEVAARVGLDHAVAVSSGTAALHLAMLLLGVGPGDDVIGPSLTFVASANVVAYVGGNPVFIDSSPDTWTIDPELLADELKERARSGRLPKAVIAVDLYGQCADYGVIEELCARYEVPLVEDAAEAIGSTYHGRVAGSFGAVGVLSFNGNKLITTSSGGMVLSSKPELVERAARLANQSREPAVHYEHREIGFNYRLSNVLAALGLGQLKVLDERIARRRAINARYREALAGVPGVGFMPVAGYGEPNSWLTCITVDPAEFGADREKVRLALETEDIESRPTWKPMHLQPAFAECPRRGGAVAEHVFTTGLCLPSGTALTDADVDRIAALVRASGRTGA